ncbi:MAG: guanylate kinase [Betaproteobacteria bacterium]|nr:guanylate kinase [Betaproteobacteria bacterium]MBK9608357.1 guanylate kinase [Betaproteobacteria bacterium]
MSGSLFIVCAPSGGGKTSIVNAVLERDPALKLSVSFTTRAPRPGEREGVHYHFVDETKFGQLDDSGTFLESALVHGHHYATSRLWLEDEMMRGHDVLLEIDVQGAEQVRKLIPSAVGIFILPPSWERLRERLVGRGQDALPVITRRLAAARLEMQRLDEFDYVIINNDFATAVEDFSAIVRASRLRSAIQRARHPELLRTLLELD